jgi:hypothetical protein
MAPACDYRVWKGLEAPQEARGMADLLADLPPRDHHLFERSN